MRRPQPANRPQLTVIRGRGGDTPPAGRLAPRTAGVGTLAVFTLASFVASLLLFMIQPVFAKMALPRLGGSPSVWNTAVVFYQTVLLGGYLFAHLLTTRLGRRVQLLVHLALLTSALLVLPITLARSSAPPAGGTPIPWLIGLLTVSVGLPFFALSTCSPSLQAWFGRTGHRSAADPYFLYAASNLGSLLSLVLYPLVIELRLGLRAQSNLWAIGYAALLVILAGCVLAMLRLGGGHSPAQADPVTTDAQDETLSWSRRGRWVFLAAIPTSLMISVTTYLSTSIAPMPLLWAVPLGLYLLTFVLVFAKRGVISTARLARLLPIVLLPLAVTMMERTDQPVWLLMVLHLLTFFIGTMVCHSAMAADRPPARHLTEFYVWMSAGGALGGLLTALIAPLVFNAVQEYPLALVLLCLARAGQGPAPAPRRASLSASAEPEEMKPEDAEGARPGHPRKRLPFPSFNWRDLWFALILGTTTAVVLVALNQWGVFETKGVGLLVFGVPALILFGRSHRPLRFALGLGALMLASSLYVGEQGSFIAADRSFFGVNRVAVERDGRFHVLFHGRTVHGMQSLDPAHRRDPLTYYARTGPIGQVVTQQQEAGKLNSVAAVGLGAGTLACYARPGESWTFFEIDPAVERIARDARYFSYLADCGNPPVVLGDARLTLESTPAAGYDLMVLDAYSSDAIPVHLMTREALALYLDKLRPGGLLTFHISNIYFDLRPVLANLAADAGLTAMVRVDDRILISEVEAGKRGSTWAVLARNPADLGKIATDDRWQRLDGDPSLPLWTDDFSSVIGLWLR